MPAPPETADAPERASASTPERVAAPASTPSGTPLLAGEGLGVRSYSTPPSAGEAFGQLPEGSGVRVSPSSSLSRATWRPRTLGETVGVPRPEASAPVATTPAATEVNAAEDDTPSAGEPEGVVSGESTRAAVPPRPGTAPLVARPAAPLIATPTTDDSGAMGRPLDTFPLPAVHAVKRARAVGGAAEASRPDVAAERSGTPRGGVAPGAWARGAARPLATGADADTGTGDSGGQRTAPARRSALTPRFLRAIQRGEPVVVLRAAMGHGVSAVAAALAGAAVLLTGDLGGTSFLVLAGWTAAGSAVAFAVLYRWRSARRGAIVLVITQLGALAWALVLLGPDTTLVVLVAPAIWLALRMGGRRAVVLCAVGALALYAAAIAAVAIGGPVPRLHLEDGARLMLHGTIGVAGVVLTAVAALAAATARDRGEAAARARLYELRLLRAELGRLRATFEDDGQRLEAALARGVRGRGSEPIAADGALSPVAEAVNTAIERLATLQKDREDRLRLEGALRTLVRALQRAWLGLAWSWPDPSGTPLDELVILLRATPPHAAAHPGDASTTTRDLLEDLPTPDELPALGAPRAPMVEVGVRPPDPAAARAGFPGAWSNPGRAWER